MTGIIIQLTISWLIVWFFEKGNLSVLGFHLTRKHLIDFCLFFLITAAFCSTSFLMKMYFVKQDWQLNPDLSAKLVFEGVWWNMKSVLFEELIFRGVILYILIKKLGSSKAIILSGVAFGMYHWFSFGVIGNIAQMIITFFITGTMGLLLAYGYSKTYSLYTPVSIHLGWNLTQIFIFSQGPIGNGILVPVNSEPFRTDSYMVLFCTIFLPMTMALLVNFLLLKQRRQVKTEFPGDKT